MNPARLALVFAVLATSAVWSEEASNDPWLSKGGKHLFALNTVLGASAASISLLGTLTGGPSRNGAVGGAEAIGLLVLLAGGGFTAGHLLTPTPPMAWSSFFAGFAGGALGVGLVTTFGGFSVPFETIVLAGAVGYALGAGLDLAFAGRDTMSWKEFWVPLAVAVIPGSALLFITLTTGNLNTPEMAALSMIYPVASFLLARAVLSVVHPFDPWVDDLLPPFRAEPIIGFGPSGAMVGIAANW